MNRPDSPLSVKPCSATLTGAAIFTAATLVLAYAPPALAADVTGNRARGEFYAREHCSTCHAVGRRGASPYPLAPPFPTLTQKYDVEDLAEAFAEGTGSGHSGARRMQVFTLTVNQIDDLIAYLGSLEPAEPAKSRPGSRNQDSPGN